MMADLVVSLIARAEHHGGSAALRPVAAHRPADRDEGTKTARHPHGSERREKVPP